MHLQPMFEGAARVGGEVDEEIFADGLCLPSGSGMTPAQQDRVIDAIRDAHIKP